MAEHKINTWHEVQDQGGIWTLFEHFLGRENVHIPLLDLRQYGIPFTLTRFMIGELIVAGIVAWLFIWLARRVRDGGLPQGRGWNALESILLFVRNQIARPAMGDQVADVFLPYLWTLFLFILLCNLLGMVPFFGSPTASIWMTGGLAVLSFLLFHAVPIKAIGFVPYLKTMWVPVDIPVLGQIISLTIFLIELMGTFIKATVLAIRLFANIFAGHVALATILVFAATANILTVKGIGISLASVLGAIALSMLELLVAFLQAYIFVFLTALFISLPLIHHAEHEAEHAHEHGHGHGHGSEPVPAPVTGHGP